MAAFSSANDAVAEYLAKLYSFDSVQDNETVNANLFTDDREAVTKVVENNIVDELWSEADFLTSENILSDGPGQQRISSLHSITLLTKSSKITTPSFLESVNKEGNEDVQLTGLWKSLGATPVDMEFQDGVLDDESLEAVKKQLFFGTDVAAEVMKNCIASHNVIYSFLYSLLQFLRAKVVESECFHDDAKGKDMLVCRIIEVCAEIVALIQESKKATSSSLIHKADAVLTEAAYLKAVGKRKSVTALPPKCQYCKTTGHGYTPILGQFSSAIRNEYRKRNEIQITEYKNVHKTVIPDNFITRSALPNKKKAGKVEMAASQTSEFIDPIESRNIKRALRRATFNNQVTSLLTDYLDSKKQIEQQRCRDEEMSVRLEAPAQELEHEEATTMPEEQQVIDERMEQQVTQESRKEEMENLEGAPIRKDIQGEKNGDSRRQQGNVVDAENYTSDGLTRGTTVATKEAASLWNNVEASHVNQYTPISESLFPEPSMSETLALKNNISDDVKQRHWSGASQRQKESVVETEKYVSNRLIRGSTVVEAASIPNSTEATPVTRPESSMPHLLAKIVDDVVTNMEEPVSNIIPEYSSQKNLFQEGRQSPQSISTLSSLPHPDFLQISSLRSQYQVPNAGESIRRDQSLEQMRSLHTTRRDPTLEQTQKKLPSPISPLSPTSFNSPHVAPSERTANTTARDIRLSECFGSSPSAPFIAQRDRQTQKTVKKYISKIQKG